MYGCVLSTVATAALVLSHQVISIHSAEWISIVLDQLYAKSLHVWSTALLTFTNMV